MTGLISKRPFIGFATSILFSALGMLLIQIDPSPVPSKVIPWFFRSWDISRSLSLSGLW